MRLAITNEMSIEPSPHEADRHFPWRRRPQFRLRTFMFTCVAFHLSIGFVGATTFAADMLSYQWFGGRWMGEVRRTLVDHWGWPTDFVCTYGSFSMLALPTWIALAPIGFLLGLAKSKYAHLLAWTLAIAMPVASSIDDVRSPVLLTPSYIRIISLVGMAIVLGCWWLGWIIRGRTEQQRTEFQSWWIRGFLAMVVVAISSYGWWLITLPLDT
ncbi:MAG: hypothetical protein K8T91_18610 [Planctomycetes bacterium]|nr:hypothetical protein [Planctomycetota bacterium]